MNLADSSLIHLIIPIFLIIVSGYLFKKTGKLQASHSADLIGFVMEVSIPAMIIVGMSSEDAHAYDRYFTFFLTFLLITAMVLVVAWVYARWVRRHSMVDSAYFSATASLSNTCMIAFPILVLLLGHVGAIYGILGVIVLIVGLQVMSVIADYHKNQGTGASLVSDLSRSLWSTAKQPYFIAFLIGIVLSLLAIKLPVVIHKPLSLLGDTAVPVALFAIGLDLDFSVFKTHFLLVVEGCFFKLIATFNSKSQQLGSQSKIH